MPTIKLTMFSTGNTTEVEMEGSTGEDLVRQLDLVPDSTLLMKDGKPIPDDLELADGDEITMIVVVSGG